MAIGQNIPLFFRLYHKLKQEIIRGEIPKGTKIDTIETLAKQHGMSQTSVRKSLELLEAEGFLVRKQGWGTMVPENLNLQFFDLANLVTSRKTLPDVRNAEIEVIDAEWIKPNQRAIEMLNLNKTAAKQSIYKLYCRINFTGKLKFKALMTFFLPKKWLNKVKSEESDSAHATIIRLTEWMESNPITVKESLLPSLCTDTHADLLGIPDGTPVFFYTVVLSEAETGACAAWEMISTANLYYREIKLYPEAY